MKRKSGGNSAPKNWQSMCGQPGPEDGRDPRDFFKRTNRRKDDRKDWQLCRQVFETLSYVMSGACGDDILRGVIVVEVSPAPDARRLLVRVCPLPGDTDFNPILVMERLTHATGRLRAEVARSISRRKVPELLFRVVADQSSVARAQGGKDDN
ncbi:ribosome-binding factor A [Schlesneria paludicola]|uniref:ribosome-binding factor A n=1 Tax=Schlesneria paludicola TaxID=360056 RepID=UPI00058CF03B|nr:ribosome-binding factor A [Schlesneria paludicola]